MKVSIRVSAAILTLALGLVLALNAQNGKPASTPVFRSTVDVVFAKVSVTDNSNRYVTGLEREHFKIFEDKVEQSICYFGTEHAPVSVGIIFDVSGSMNDNSNIGQAKKAVDRFLQSGNPEDEYFLVTFNQKTTLVQSFTGQSASLQNGAALQKPGGRTALYDAVYLGLDLIKGAKNDKKALILVTDGEDNSSRYSPLEVREFAKESDAQIYGIGQEGNLNYGRSEITSIVSLTGGRAFFPHSFSELDYYIDLIHSELRNQYLLGYIPTNKVHDGRWRHIKVQLDAPKGLPKLVVNAKEGYYAPKN
jgi:Ca-activated chloride channel family protein